MYRLIGSSLAAPEPLAGRVLTVADRTGGSAWESNPPGMGLPPHNGFEDRGRHRAPSTPVLSVYGASETATRCRASAYDAIHLVEFDAGQRYVVDTGHMAAFDDTVTYDVGRVGSWKSTLLGGEGLVVKLTGPGRFYLQTRNPESFVEWLVPTLPGKRQ